MRVRTLTLVKIVLVMTIVLYYGKGVLYPSDSIVSTASLGIFLIISSYFFILLSLRFKTLPIFVKVWTILLVANISLFLLSGDMSNDLHFSYFAGTLACMLPMYPFYALSKRAVIHKKDLVLLFALLFPLAVLQFFEIEFFDLSTFSADMLIPRGTNNISYALIGLMPILFFFRKQFLALSIGMVIVFLLFLSLKRGAILSGLIIFSMLAFSYLFTKDRRKSLFQQILLFTFLVVSLFLLYGAYLENEILVNRMTSMVSERDSSERDVIWSVIVSEWFERADWYNMLFGFGFAGSIVLTGSHFAHNDWLELFAGLGVFGVLIYFFLFCSIINFWRKIKFKSHFWWLWAAFALSTMLISAVSIFYATLHFAPTAIVLAYLLATHNPKVSLSVRNRSV